MKKFPILMLSILATPVFAQSMLSSLSKYQNTLESKENKTSASGSASASSSSSSTPDVKSSSQSSSSSVVKCNGEEQTSLPLPYLKSLIQEKDGPIEFHHDPRTATLEITAADMIGNCSSMLDWKLKRPEIENKKAYAIEVQIKKNDTCTESGCVYKVAKVENKQLKGFVDMTFPPTLTGFEQCLEQSGVVVKGKVVPSAIYNAPVKEKFSNLNESGKILFLSHGSISQQVKPQYGKFDYVHGCDFYESHPTVKELLNLADVESALLNAEAQELKNCNVDDYGKLSEFIEKYEAYSTELGVVRDRLILEAAKKSAKAMADGTATEEDLKVLADFEKYVVDPKIDEAVALYNQMIELEGNAKAETKKALEQVLKELSALNKAPYFTPAHLQKLINEGKFDEAEKLNSLLVTIDNYRQLGNKKDNVVITPQVAAERVVSTRALFSNALVKEKEVYEIRTGQVTGNAQYYANLSKRMRENIQIRSQNFSQEIHSEYARIQPNGYCYRYWRNTQKCTQDTYERIQELSNLLQHYNKIDLERAAEYDTKAKEYGDLEAQGRRYIAAQNGEPVPEEVIEAPAGPDTTVPGSRPQDDQAPYTFNFQSGNPYEQQMAQEGQQFMQHQRPQMTPNNYQYPVYPTHGNNMFQGPQTQQYPQYPQYPNYQHNSWQTQTQQYQTPWLGQQSYNMNGHFGFGQQPQQNYWNQPNQAYTNYSMYGMYGR